MRVVSASPFKGQSENVSAGPNSGPADLVHGSVDSLAFGLSSIGALTERASFASPPMANYSRITRMELCVVLTLLLLGFAFRIWKISSVGLDHFDEGVYVFSALGLTDP